MSLKNIKQKKTQVISPINIIGNKNKPSAKIN